MRSLSVVFVCLLLAVPLRGQRQRPDPLTDAQAQQIAEAGIDPDARIALYTKFLNERADALKGLMSRAHSAARGHRIDAELQNFTALMDELGSNLDEYGDRKADMRKALKALNEAIPRWQQVLNGLPTAPAFEISRQDAIDSSNDLSEQAKQLLADQTAYFKLHKDQKGQQRAEPE